MPSKQFTKSILIRSTNRLSSSSQMNEDCNVQLGIQGPIAVLRLHFKLPLPFEFESLSGVLLQRVDHILGFGSKILIRSQPIHLMSHSTCLIGSNQVIHSPPLYKSSETWFSAQFSVFEFSKCGINCFRKMSTFSFNKPIRIILEFSIDRITATASQIYTTSITLVSSAAIRKLGNIRNRDLPYHTQYLETRSEINGISMLSLRENLWESGLQIVDLDR